MKLTSENKDAIRDALVGYCNNYPSRNRAAESLQGVSSAVVSQICNSKYESISDDMFVRLARQIGFSFDEWAILETNNYKLATFFMADAQLYKNVHWLIGDAGCGKTTAALEYRRNHRNVFYILCSEDMRRSDFVREIAKQVGSPVDGGNLRDTLECALSMISYVDNPVLIFDEGDKLTDCVLNYFISIYNRLEGRCGIVFLSTDYMQRRMDAGIRYNKKGYKEIRSRIGRKFVPLDPTSQNDIYAICKENGIENETDIKRIIKESDAYEQDLRRVKRIIHASKRKMDALKAKGE